MFQTGEADEYRAFTLYRKRIRGFTFGEDYAEYFCGLPGGRGTKIYQGKVRCTNNRKFTFYDREVKTGEDYAYFVKTKHFPPVGPVPVRIRDLKVWWPYAETRKRIEALGKEFSRDVTIETCGHTVEGREIPCIVAGRGAPSVGLVGLIHGGESGPELIIPAIEYLLKHERKLLRKRAVVAIPAVNIDSRERMVRGVPWYIRKNAAGVDLNRNYPVQWDRVHKGYGLVTTDPQSGTYRGARPASEPETRAVMKALSEHTPEVVFSMHCLASLCGLPGLGPGISEKEKSFKRKAVKFIELYGKGLYPDEEFADNWLRFSTCSGDLPAWCKDKLGIPCFDMEMGIPVTRKALDLCRYDLTDRTLLKEYQVRHRRAILNVLGYCAREA